METNHTCKNRKI